MEQCGGRSSAAAADSADAGVCCEQGDEQLALGARNARQYRQPELTAVLFAAPAQTVSLLRLSARMCNAMALAPTACCALAAPLRCSLRERERERDRLQQRCRRHLVLPPQRVVLAVLARRSCGGRRLEW
jgi:hypothetical protein